MMKTIAIPKQDKLTELVIYHNGYKTLSILTEDNLVEPFCKVIDLSYNLGIRDMNRALIKPSEN